MTSSFDLSFLSLSSLSPTSSSVPESAPRAWTAPSSARTSTSEKANADMTYVSRAGFMLGDLGATRKPDIKLVSDTGPPIPTKPSLVEEDSDTECEEQLPNLAVEWTREVSDLSQKGLSSPRSSFYVMDKYTADHAQKPDRYTHEAHLRNVCQALKDVQRKPRRLENQVERRRFYCFGT